VYKTFIVVVPWQGNVYSWEKGGFAMQSVNRENPQKKKKKGRRIGDSYAPKHRGKDLYL
jgi:hypothetical protein